MNCRIAYYNVISLIRIRKCYITMNMFLYLISCLTLIHANYQCTFIRMKKRIVLPTTSSVFTSYCSQRHGENYSTVTKAINAVKTALLSCITKRGYLREAYIGQHVNILFHQGRTYISMNSMSFN
jgi:hypothetical protein